MDDVFSLQDQIAERVVASIEPKVRFAEIERVRHKPAANLDAYDLLLRALQLEHEFTQQSLAAASNTCERQSPSCTDVGGLVTLQGAGKR